MREERLYSTITTLQLSGLSSSACHYCNAYQSMKYVFYLYLDNIMIKYITQEVCFP